MLFYSVNFFFFLFFLSSLVYASATNPPNGRTGAPPTFASCTECHTSFSLNSGNGSLRINGLPDYYVAGQTYSLQIELADPGQSRWGFQTTSLTTENTRAGTLIRTLTTHTNLEGGTGTNPQYLEHTSTGTYAGTANGPVFWPFQWTAPATNSGVVTFYIAGNVANNNGNNSGDYIYTRQFPIPEYTTPSVLTSLSISNQLSSTSLVWVKSSLANLYHIKEYVQPYSNSVQMTIATTDTQWTTPIDFSVTPQKFYRVTAHTGTRLSTVIQNIFTTNCVGCHSEGGSGNLNLSSASASYLNLVNVPSSYELMRVVPFDTTNSVLWQKVNGNPEYGSQMPVGGSLSTQNRTQIMRWILEGAVDY